VPGRALVEFFFAPGSRYSYLAASQMTGLEREFECVVDWRPVHGPAVRALRGADPFAGAPVSGQYEWPYRRRDAERWANHYGIRFREPPSHDIDFELLARAATAAKRLDCAAAYGWAITSAVYGSDAWPLDERVCLDVAVTVGLDALRFETMLRDPATQAALDATADEAHRRGVFGVPTFLVAGELFWGNDRLVLLRDHLRARGR
jgi:2-hydroxychromene-2-carboxylate isomerase